MRRLSIIDIQTGHQPISNEDENVWIVYNGEIYNHAELRKDLEARGHRYRTNSDTETIVHLYEEYGRDCVKYLRGMFAFAIWDRGKRVLFIARDRLGIKPLYYRSTGKRCCSVGNQGDPGLSRRRRRVQSRHARRISGIRLRAGAETMYAGIRKLLPGHTLEIARGRRAEDRAVLGPPIRGRRTERPREYYVERYRELLEGCVSSHLMSDVPLGVFLSGDSTPARWPP